jgi:hypothetical protein
VNKLRTLWTLFILTVLIIPTELGVGRVAAAGTTYYVATNGNDSWSGTLTAPNGGGTDGPFRTIQRCATVAAAGSTCNIRAGVYRETVTPANNGTAVDPITFQPYNNEDVTISGNDVITGWTAHDLAGGKAIYKASLPWSMNVRTTSGTWQITNNQIFVDGAMMPEAQYPNLPVADVTHPKNSQHLRSTGVANLAQFSATYVAPQIGNFPTNFWQGTKINFSPGSTIFWATCDVTGNSGTAISFQCNPDPGAWNNRSAINGTWTTPGIGNYFYLWGKYEALDAPGEWFRDAAGTLYLWTPDSTNPATKTIEARRRAWGIDLANRSYINVKGIKLVAAGINSSSTSHHINISEIDGRYMWHFQEIPPLSYIAGTQAIRFWGSDMTLTDSVIYGTAGPLINIGGDTNTPYTSNIKLTNNVVYDTTYMANGASVWGGITGNNGTGSQFHLVKSNTMWNSGQYMVFIGPGISIYNNDLYQSHQQISDLATLYNWNTDALGAEIAYNYVHDNYGELDTSLLKYGGLGIFLDDNSDNSVIHHNITWSTTSPGISVFGKDAPGPGHRKIYNNTVDGNMTASAKTTGGYNQTLTGTEYRNNIATQADLSDPNLTKSNNLIGEGGWMDRAGRDYTLRADSVAIDQGMVLPPYTNGYAGANPDQGALEYGRVPFVAGAVVRERDLAGLTAQCEPDMAGVVATCTVRNLPLGRKLPNELQIRIGTATAAQYCTTPMNYTTNYGVGICKNVPIGGQTGIQPITVNLGNGWVSPSGSTVDLGGLAIFSVFPPGGTVAGGTQITLTGRRFAYANNANYRVPITISNTSGQNVSTMQVLVQFNTASLIAAGKLRSDCGDLRFSDTYGQLSYWLEDGCNTTTTRVWVKVLGIPTSGSTIYMTYGNAALTSASNPKGTFVYFPDLSSATVDPVLQLNGASGISVTQTGGQIRVTGTTTPSNQYNSYGFVIQTWMLNMPQSFAIDANLSVISGTNTFKGAMGQENLYFFDGIAPKKIGYWNGSSWTQLGTSTVNSATFNNKKLSVGVMKNASDYTLRWTENGNTTVLASRTVASAGAGSYNYGPDTVASFDARFSNVRIRNYVYPEPTTSVGAETVQASQFTIGGIACQNVIVTSYTTATCTTPPHPVGRVNIAVTNPDLTTANFATFGYVAKPDTIGLFKPSTGEWFLRNSNTTGGADITLSFGGSVNHLPITGDWDGDGVDTVGIYDTSNGVFQLRDSNTTGPAQYVFTLGNPGDTPLAGRWDNTMNHDGAGVYRNSNGILYLRKTLTTGFSDYYMVLGNPGDQGIAGDWDGDGYDSVGVYRASQNRFYLSNVNGNGITYADVYFDYGDTTAKPIAGDWSLNAYHRVGYFRDGQVWLRYTNTTGVSDVYFAFGFTGALPVTGKWTGASLPNPNSVIVYGNGGSSQPSDQDSGGAD